MNISKTVKLGVVGAISSIPILYSLLAVVFFLSRDVNWFYSHFGYETGYEFILLPFIAFSLATLVLANYWLKEEEGRSKRERTIATICGLGLTLFYATVLLTMSAGALVGGLAIERLAWVMFFGFFSGLFMSSIGAVLHFVFASDFGDLESI